MKRWAKVLILVGLGIIVLNVMIGLLINVQIGGVVVRGRFGMGLLPAAAAAVLCVVGAIVAVARRSWLPWAAAGLVGFVFSAVAFGVALHRMAAAVQGASTAILTAKTEEARLNLHNLGLSAKEYFYNSPDSAIALTAEAPPSHFPSNARVAGPCAAPSCNVECVPRDFALVKGTTYQPTEDDWHGGGSDADPSIWWTLGFSPTEPLRFQYCCSSSGNGAAATIRFFAFGDLDGDGTPSEFSVEEQAGAGDPVIAPLEIHDEFE